MFDHDFKDFDTKLTKEAESELEDGMEETANDVQPVNITPADI